MSHRRGAGRAQCARRTQGDRFGDGFADGFPTEALTAALKAKLQRPSLAKADWVTLSIAART